MRGQRQNDGGRHSGAELIGQWPGYRSARSWSARRVSVCRASCQGARNHRFGLSDGILVKDNHLSAAGGIHTAVEKLRAAGTTLPIEIEAETIEDVREAVAVSVDSILLDNMAPAAMREAVAFVAGRATLEASGGVSLETVREIAETGVDFVSVGALTHAARSLDVSLEML